MAASTSRISQKVDVREGRPSDAASIASMGAATFEASFGHSMPKEHLDDYLSTTYTETNFAKELQSPQDQFFIAELPSSSDATLPTPVGFVQVRKGSTEPCIPNDVPGIEIYRIYVSKDHLGCGAGKVLMARAMQYAEGELAKERTSGQKALIWLGVWEENVKAHRFYRRFGLEKVGTHDFVMGDTTQTDDIIMKWV